MKINSLILLVISLFVLFSCDDGIKFDNPYDINSDAYNPSDTDTQTNDDDSDKDDTMSEYDDEKTDTASTNDDESVSDDSDSDSTPDDADSIDDSGDSEPDESDSDDDSDSTDSEPDNSDSAPDNDTDTDSGDSAPDNDNPTDNNNLNTGDTSGNQAQSGATGAPCTSDSQCTGTYSGSYGGENYDQEAFCLTENNSYFPAPGGYCTFMCDSTDHAACDNAGGVYHGYNSWGDGYCFHRCTKPSDCRVGYRCSNKIHACMPDCKAAGYECTLGQCDETDGVCLNPKDPSDPCNPNPCGGIANSTGVCTVSGTGYSCACNSGYFWNGQKCAVLPECSATSGTPCKDSTSQLIWSTKTANTNDKTWEQAVVYCQNLNEGGFFDWHLPTIDELRTLIKNCPGTETNGACAISEKNGKLSGNDSSDDCSCAYKSGSYYSKIGDDHTVSPWSSSTRSDDPDRAWYVGFFAGVVSNSDKTTVTSDVRCVRK